MEAVTARATRRRPAWLAGLIPVAVLALAIGVFVALDAPGLDRIGVPEEELAVERTVMNPGEIELHVRNDGADPVEVKQVIVNDGYVAFTQSEEKIGRLGGAEIDVQYPWIEGQAYEVALLTATGATIEHTIDAAALANLLNAGNTYADARTQAILGSPNFRVRNRTLGPRLAQLGVPARDRVRSPDRPEPRRRG